MSPEPAGPRPAHVPVMVDRVVELLAPTAPGLVVDATVGAGGHAKALLAASPPGTALVGLDRDPRALVEARRQLAGAPGRVELLHRGYEDLGAIVDDAAAAHGPLRAVLYDLGVSSLQLDDPERGFSLQADGPLDLRMDPTEGESAAELLDRLDVDALGRLLREHGEERQARRIAQAIHRARPVRRTGELARVVAEAVPAAARPGRHPATKTFQALRIAVNGELDRFRASLPQALERLAPASDACPSVRGGRLAVLAYHSLEDRLAKAALADGARGCICPPDLPVCGCGRRPWLRLLTRGAERPTDTEVSTNPRARSARLRAGERTSEPRPA